jgi:hypothetical protein
VTVYVDDVRHRYGRMIMCHMWADTLDELLAMADRIGVAKRWLQKPPKATWLHFDVCVSKKAAAIAAGAVLMDKYAPAEHCARLAGNAHMLELITKSREMRGLPSDGRVTA